MRSRFHTLILVLGFALLSLAFSSEDDRIRVNDFKVNGKLLGMLFDSGSEGIGLTSDAVKRLGLKVVEPPTNGLPGVTAAYTVDWQGNSFQTDFAVLEIPGYAASDFDGILGWWPVRSSILKIDGSSRRITFLWHVPRAARNWTKFTIMTNSGTLDLEVPRSDGTKGIVTVDTGQWFGIGLSPSLCREWKNTHPHFPMTLRTSITPRGFTVVYEAFADKIDIGPLHITDVPILQLDSRGVIAPKRDNQDAVLGLAALSRLDFVVDGPHNLAYLRAKTTPAGPYPYNRLGAVFRATTQHPNQLLAIVIVGSPAYDAGIRDGDTLVQVDGIHPNGWTTNWLSKFDMPAGTKLRFTLQRNGTNFQTTATLREILKPNSGK